MTKAAPLPPGDFPEHQAADWPLRPWLLAALLGLAGLLIHLVSHGHHETPWRVAVAAFAFFGPIAAALSIDRDDWRGPALFAAALGLVMAGLAWRAVQYGTYLPDEQYGFAAGVVASLLALPLFQAGFLRRRFATPYADVHYHVWNDALAGAGAMAFTGIAWGVLAILAELFHLLKIDLLRDLMNADWFGWTFSGVAFGAGLGTLRNQASVLGTLQSVAMLVLSLLAVPLALGLAVFLVATAVSGPEVLWHATRSATPVLLTCAVGAFGLCNAVIRNNDARMTGARVMRLAAWVLALVILPLAAFAAVSLGLRLGQYGLAPERLWGLVAIAVACAFGVGYWAALLRGRKAGWAGQIRLANLHLAAGVAVLALLLALPILDFGGIATRNQIARLHSGKVSVEDFDYSALRWDFGQPGQRALAGLAGSGGAVQRKLAAAAIAQKSRPWNGSRQPRITVEQRWRNLRLQPESAVLRDQLQAWLTTESWRCEQPCTAIDLGPGAQGGRRIAFVQGASVDQLLVSAKGNVENTGNFTPVPLVEAKPAADPRVELRPWNGRRVYVDGRPVGQPFD